MGYDRRVPIWCASVAASASRAFWRRRRHRTRGVSLPGRRLNRDVVGRPGDSAGVAGVGRNPCRVDRRSEAMNADWRRVTHKALLLAVTTLLSGLAPGVAARPAVP